MGNFETERRLINAEAWTFDSELKIAWYSQKTQNLNQLQLAYTKVCMAIMLESEIRSSFLSPGYVWIQRQNENNYTFLMANKTSRNVVL